jgi:hypothetical protein
MVEKIGIKYEGWKWLIVIFGILMCLWPGITLFAFFFLCVKNLKIITNKKVLYLEYKGSYFFLFLWTFVFCPVALILFVINGCDLIKENNANKAF